MFKGAKKDKVISILYHDEHYDAITTLSGFFGKSYYCLDCEKSANRKNVRHHRCKGKRCGGCYQFDCPDFANSLTETCLRCNRRLKGSSCRRLHLTRTEKGDETDDYLTSVCGIFKRCDQCGKYFELTKGTVHRCGFGKCTCCKQTVDLCQHKCFVQPFKIPTRKRKFDFDEEDEFEEIDDADDDETEEEIPCVFVYFDIESMQETGVHIPNLLICQTSESEEMHCFEGEQCVSDFLDDLEEECDGNVVVVAHNMKGYDGYFILNEYYARYSTPNLILQGAKILSMSLRRVKFIDSLNFLQMPLASFASTFKLEEKKKGFFPHFFNTAENQNYVGKIPDESYFDPEGMSEGRRQEFDVWYKKQTGAYNFHDELVAYCESDVELLKLGCQCFQNEFERAIGFNPMKYHVTMASACNAAYQFKFMPENSIPVEPFNGWTGGLNINHSTASIEWLE